MHKCMSKVKELFFSLLIIIVRLFLTYVPLNAFINIISTSPKITFFSYLLGLLSMTMFNTFTMSGIYILNMTEKTKKYVSMLILSFFKMVLVHILVRSIFSGTFTFDFWKFILIMLIFA